MYIYIFEEGQAKQSTTPPTKADVHAIKDGLLQVIDCKTMETFVDDEWLPLEAANANGGSYHS